MQRNTQSGEVRKRVSPLFYNQSSQYASYADRPKIDIFLYLPGTTILAEGEDVLLVKDADKRLGLGLVDLNHNHIFRLIQPTYLTAFAMLKRWPPYEIGLIRNHATEAVGFWLWSDKRLVAMLQDDAFPEKDIYELTRIFVTPGKLMFRESTSAPWQTLLWHLPPPLINTNQ